MVHRAADLRRLGRWILALVSAVVLARCASAASLTRLEYHVTGTALQVSPAAVSVPKGIAGSVLVSVVSGGSTNTAASAQLSAGAYVEAILRGPAFPEPRRLVGPPNAALLLPAINLVGDYQLDSIRLVDSTTGATRLEGVPSSVPVHVFDELLISRVTSRPLTFDEIQQKGIVIDESNFRAVEFEVSFVLDGKTIPITFPVVSPQFKDSTELIPAAELEARLKTAAALNQQIASQVVQLPKEFETANLNIQMQALNFQVVDDGDGNQGLGLTIPPIPALMVIPGNIGFLNQFFSVQIFTENGAPTGSGLVVSNILAQLILPPGPDGILSTNYSQPGDDPLRFARVGPNKIIQPVQTIVKPGPDGQVGTADDIPWLMPGESGQAEFLVEGLQEGLQVMNLNLTADLIGLAAGTVKVTGQAAGSVLVRNPRFSIAFSHPRTIRTGEPYTASVTVLNTGITPANLVSVTLNRNSISGAVFEDGQLETVPLGTILPGQTATATYHLRAQRTGAISFSNLTTSDDSTVGRFRFSMGVDERGVALSPDSLAMPDFVNSLPSNIVAAATRVLGQALSVATAGQLPAGVRFVPTSIITTRVLELAEAGQRVGYGDPLNRVLPDLLRDWQGGRSTDDGFDQLLRVTDAGQEWRAALYAEMEAADHLTGTGRLVDRAADLTGLGQAFALASSGNGQLRADFGDGTDGATAQHSTQPYALTYGGTNGSWSVTPQLTNTVFVWTFTNGPPSADVAVLLLGSNGQAQRFRWSLAHPLADAVYRFALNDPTHVLQVDLGGDGSVDSTLNPVQAVVNELPPTLVAVQQDLSVVAGRPANPCGGPPYFNYGTVVAVVFSKPMTQSSAGVTDSYTVEGDNGANSVQVQPSGRVALLNLRKGISALRPRNLIVTGVTDVRGNPLAASPTLVQCFYPGTTNLFTGGVAVRGRVLKGDGSPAVGVPVTLTMYDQVQGSPSCDSWIRRVSQVLTDTGGNFDFDFVMSGIGYSISASDTTGLSGDALRLIMESTITSGADRQRIEQLANSADTRNTLLGALSAGSLPEAVAKVEGIDRAVVQDFVAIGSGREGQTVPFALRFRGRATVVGQVVAADGVTPISQAAVNLFPDPASREQGSGVFADANGQFTFFGVPLGVFTIDVKTSDQRGRTVAGLLDTPGQTMNVLVAVPSNQVFYGTLRGQVFEADNLTPNGNGHIFIGQYNGVTVANVIRIVDADASGFWEVTNVPVRSLDIVAVTFDGQRKGVRVGITPSANLVTYANVTLESVTRVFGRVQYDDGRPAPNALVAGGVALVRSDTNGNFQLDGVPVGFRTISAGLERNPAAGIDFPRLGTSGANIIAGTDNYVLVKLRPAGRIFGKVFDAQGNVQGGIRVAIPQEGGFYWTDADNSGNYVFENLGLGNYTVSAPANAVAPQINESQLLGQIRSGNEDQILAAMQEAVTVFVGAEDPLITGAHLNFRPSTWGYTTAQLRFDGQSVNANVRFIVQGSLSGTVINGQGVPLGARVRLTGVGPTPTGFPATTIRGELNSDPATGQFAFPGELLAGGWTVQAASPFFPTVISQSGFTTEIDPDVTNVVLQFPPIRDINGRIAGRVFNPDGSLVGAGVQVKINISADYQIQTGSNGVFDTQVAVPAAGYIVDAFDAGSGLKGRSYVNVVPGITNFVDVHLLSRNSTVQVTVVRANGQPAGGALVELDPGSYPYDAPLTATADAAGHATFDTLWEGNYAVVAQYTEAATRVFARAGGSVAPNATLALTLQLGGTGSIQGTFVQRDLITPIFGAQVAIGNLGFANTDTNGYFRFDGVPLGAYQILSSDPVTGASAATSASLTFADQVQTVQLIEALRGEVDGLVIDSYGLGYAAGATVRINFSDGRTPSRTVTTGPNGQYSFPGSPMGNFAVSATFTLAGGLQVSGYATGVLTETLPTVNADIALQSLAVLTIKVVRNDGTNPATNTRVTLGARQQDTDTNGIITFSDLPLASGYAVQAISQVGGELRNGTVATVNITTRGTNPVFTVTLPGVGKVQGTVFASDGVTPVPNAEVLLRMQAPPFAGVADTALTDAQGNFSFSDIAVGPYVLSASSQSLAGSLNGSISTAGEVDTITLRLGDSGTLIGRVVRADGTNAVGGVDVVIDYASQSANAGIEFFRTAADGLFRFDNIPVGAVHVSSVAASFGGIIDFTTALVTNGQTLDLGDRRFDEDLPAVVQVTPADTAVAVPITTTVDLLFSEELATNSIHSNGIYIRGTNGVVAATVALSPDTNGVPRLVRITPKAPLLSQRMYEVVVLSGDLLGAGGVIGSGPQDLVGRSTAAPFLSHFTTADNDPPVLLSLFPSNNAVQIDPSSVPRLSFNETLRSTGFVFQVKGPGGLLVLGAAGVGVNGQVLSFVPTAFLQPNARYTLTVSNVFDLAGNRAVGEPFTASFATLDTIGPTIATLRIASNLPPVAAATVPIEALLANTNEPGASVRFTQDFAPLGTATNTPYRANVALPLTGSTTVRAIATDQYGNDGPMAELAITVQANQPPTVQFTRVSPTTGPAPSGSFVVVDVTAADDSGVSQLKAIVAGIAAGNLSTTNGTKLRVQGFVPATATADQQVQIFAEAIDNIGQSSGQQIFTLPIGDGTKPTLSVLSPTNDARLNPAAPLNLAVVVSDNSTNVTLGLVVSGSLTATQTVSLALIPNQPVTNVFSVSLAGAPANGGSITAALVVTDGSGNSATTTASFRLPDSSIPVVQSYTPINGATGVAVLPAITVNFSEPMDTNTISAATFQVTRGGAAVNGSYVIGGNTNVVSFVPSAPLNFGATYQVALTVGITDLSGNPIAPTNTQFTVTDFGITLPTNNTPIVEGQRVRVAAGGSNPSGIRSVEYHAGTNIVAGAAPAFTNLLATPMLADLGSNVLAIQAFARIGGTNVARGAPATASSVYPGSAPSQAVDGNRDGNYGNGSVFVTDLGLHAFWEVDLGTAMSLAEIDLYLRTDGSESRNRFAVLVASAPFVASDFTNAALPAAYSNGAVEVYRTTNAFDQVKVLIPVTAFGRYVRVVHLATDYLTLAEVEVYDLPVSLQLQVPVNPVLANVYSRQADTDGDGVSNGDEIDRGTDPFKPDSAPVIQFPNTITVAQTVPTNFSVTVTDASANLRLLRVDELGPGGTTPAKAEFWDIGHTLSLLSNVDFTAPPTFATTFDTLSYSTTSGPFWPGGPVQYFAARFSGSLVVPAAGSYTFYASSDDGSRILVDGQVVVDYDGVHGAGEQNALAFLTAGIHSFVTLYFQNVTSASLQVSWSGPTFAKRLVQQSDFRQFGVLQFAESGSNVVTLATNGAALTATLQIRRDFTNAVNILLTAQDAGGPTNARTVAVVTLPANGGNPLSTNHPPIAGAGGALRFDGVGTFVDMGNPPSLQITGSQTVEFWINPANFDARRNVISKAYGGEGSITLETDGSLQYYYGTGGVDGSPYQGLLSGSAIPRGTWTHVAFVRDLTAMKLRGYFNGQLVAEIDALYPAAVAGLNPFQIGRGSFASVVAGDLDEVSVWSRALSAAEIQAGMNTRRFGNEPGLAAAWSFDEASGLARDCSSNHNDGILGDNVAALAPARVASSAPLGVFPTVTAVGAVTYTVALTGSDPDGDPLTYHISSLPPHGNLFQTADGVTKGAAIAAAPAVVSNAQHQVIYEPTNGFIGRDVFAYAVNDGKEDSMPAPVAVNVYPADTPPIATGESFSAFQNSPFVIANLLTNDTDADGDVLKVVIARPPTNGTLTANPDGTFTYMPRTNYAGPDSFVYAVADKLVWNRSSDYQEGLVNNSTVGNPLADHFGVPAWRLEYLRGAALTNAVPWYQQPGGKMLWDSSWYGGPGLWAFSINFGIGSVINQYSSSENLTDASWISTIPAMTWISPLNNTAVDIVGTLQVEWAQPANVAAPVDIDVVLALRPLGGLPATPLYTNTVSKPTPAPTATERIALPIWIQNLAIHAGDEIVATMRARNPVGPTTANLYDQIYIMPSAASRYATATLNVVSNHPPVLVLPTNVVDGTALRFDGVSDYVDFGNPPALQITGDQTIEFWIKPADFNVIRNPIGKAYGGEGTININVDGTMNYIYGTAGADSQPYQVFNSIHALATNQWQHVALVRDLTHLKLRWFINGQLVNETVANYTAAVASANAFQIGRGYAGYLSGDMDEVRVWNVARTLHQIGQTMFSRLKGNEPGLAGYWNFDEGTGTQAADHSPNGLTGILGGGIASRTPLWVPSPVPSLTALTTLEETPLTLKLDGTDADNDPIKVIVSALPQHGRLYQTSDGVTPGADIGGDLALDFDGIADIVTIAEKPSADLSRFTNWTITAWIKPRATVLAYPIIYGEGNWGITLGLTGTGQLESWINDSAAYHSTGIVTLGQWQHVALVYDGSQLRFYIGGQASGSVAIPTISGDSSGAAIGGIVTELNSSRNRFNGAIDEVALWNVALTDQSLQQFARAPLTGTEAGLAAWWPFNEPGGDTLADPVGGANAVLGGGVTSYKPQRVFNDAPAFAARLPVVTDTQRRVIYVPDTNYFGLDQVGYRLNDGKVNSSDGTLLLAVQAVNHAPVAVNDTILAVLGLPQQTGNLLANDYDVDGDPFSLLDFTSPTNGTLVGNGDGTFTYTPQPGFTGVDGFTYRITDGQSNSQPAQVTITVSGLADFRWVNGSGGNWSTPANWSQNRAPGSNDNVVIDLPGSYTVTLDTAATAQRIVLGGASGVQTFDINGHSLTLLNDTFVHSNGVLRLSSSSVVLSAHRVLIEGGLDWSGGFMQGAGTAELAPGATAVLSGGAKYLNDGWRIVNHATLQLTGGTLQIGNQHVGGAGLDNAATLNVSGGAGILFWPWNTSSVSFVNAGTLNKTGVGAQTDITVPFTNSGTVNVQEGTLRTTQGDNQSGTINVATNTVMMFDGGSYVFSPSSAIGGAGTLQLNSGNGTFAKALPVTAVVLNSGTWTFSADQTFPSYTQNGGDLYGSGKVTVTTNFSFTGGGLNGPGVFELAATATASISGPAGKIVNDGRRLLNRTTLQVSGGPLNLENLSVGGATLENMGTLNFTDEADLGWVNYDAGRLVVLTNSGTINKSGSGTTTFFNVPFANTGTVNVQQGTLQLWNGGSLSGSINLSAGTVFALTGGGFSADASAVIAGPGELQLINGSGSFANTFALTGPVTLNNGTWAFNADQTFASYSQNDGILIGTNHILVTTNFSFTGGFIKGAGTLELAATATASISGAADKEIDDGRRLLNRTTLQLIGGRLELGNQGAAGATLENVGTLNMIDGVGIDWRAFNAGVVSLLNSGTLIKTGTNTTPYINVPLINNGVINVQQGTLLVEQSMDQNSTLLILPGAVLRLNGTTYTAGSAAGFLGRGTLRLEAGNLVADHSLTLTPDFAFAGGTLSGTGTVIVVNGFAWTNGVMQGAGTTWLSQGTTTTINGASDKILRDGRRLLNFSTLTLSGKSLTLDGPNAAGATLENAGTLSATDDVDIVWANVDASKPVGFLNSGTFIKSGAGTTTDVTVLFTNSGTVRVDSGILRIQRDSTQGGALNILSGAQLQFTNTGSHTFSAGATFAGTGQVVFAQPIILATALNFGPLEVTFATNAAVSGAFAIANDVNGIIRVNQSMTFPSDMAIAGRLSITNASLTVTITGTLSLAASGTIENAGTLRVGVFNNAGGTIIGNPPIVQGPRPALRISSLEQSDGTLSARATGGAPGSGQWLLRCRGPAGAEFGVETSTDLVAWQEVEAVIVEEVPGVFRVLVDKTGAGTSFFRLKLADAGVSLETAAPMIPKLDDAIREPASLEPIVPVQPKLDDPIKQLIPIQPSVPVLPKLDDALRLPAVPIPPQAKP